MHGRLELVELRLVRANDLQILIRTAEDRSARASDGREFAQQRLRDLRLAGMMFHGSR